LELSSKFKNGLKEVFVVVKTKRFIAIALTILFLLCSTNSVMALSEVPFSQEKAIEKVKKLFDTSIYNEFNINYEEGWEQKIWRLYWYNSKEPYGNLSATIDAETGNILDLYMYKGYDSGQKSPIPILNEAEAKRIAEEFAARLQPEEFAKCIYIENQERYYYPVRSSIRPTYTFNFVRTENGIPVENDGFYITVDGGTGDILEYTFYWSKAELPPADKIISIEDARKIFKENSFLKLVYQRYFDYRSKEDEVKLVYTVDSPYRVLIDAFSGEIINQDGYYDLGYAGGMSAKEKSAENASIELTPQELKELEASQSYISKEDAVKVVKKYIKIPENYIQSSVNLYKSYDLPDEKVWNLFWIKNPKDNSTYGSIYASVNAVTGELLSFDIYDEARYSQDFKQKYNRDEAQKKAEEFLRKIQPQRFKEVKLEELTSKIEEPEKLREHHFNYTRQVNEIPFMANGFSLTVDSQTGEIISYNMRWQDRKFPEPDGILPKDEAENRFLDDIGLKLTYVKIYKPEDQSSNFRLVYKLTSSQSYTFDAKDMTPLDYNGKPIEEIPVTVFTDIEGHWAQKEIQLLVDLGIISSSENKFRPDENITQGQFIKLLMTAINRTPGDVVPLIGEVYKDKDNDIDKFIKEAIKVGIVKEGEISAEEAINREKAAAFVIRAMGYGKIASLPYIFNVPVEDASAISPEYTGHVALAIGLDILTVRSSNFYPKDPLTRAQTAVIIVRMLQTER